MMQASLFDVPRPFGGKTFDVKRDGKRLDSQYERVKNYMLQRRGVWLTLAEIHAACGGSESGISARIRDLKKPQFDGLRVESQPPKDGGVWLYRIAQEAA